MESADRESFGKQLLAGILLIVLIVAFALSPLPGGDDWENLSAASRRVWTGQPLYTQAYHNPPWLAVALSPLGLLPQRLGWAIVSVTTLIVVSAVVRRWGGGLSTMALALLSPPILYTLLHGEIDGLILGGVLLPPEWWILIGLTKPQVAIGLVFGIPRDRLVRAIVIAGLVLVASLLWFGLWPLRWLEQANPLHQGWNLWAGLWPMQVPAGVLLILLGISRKDERWLVAASPFLSPYAATSSLLGPWMVACSFLKGWQALVVLLAWWGAVVYRMAV